MGRLGKLGEKSREGNAPLFALAGNFLDLCAPLPFRAAIRTLVWPSLLPSIHSICTARRKCNLKSFGLVSESVAECLSDEAPQLEAVVLLAVI